MYQVDVYDASQRDEHGGPKMMLSREHARWGEVEPYFDEYRVDKGALYKVQLSPRGIIASIIGELSRGCVGLTEASSQAPSAYQANEFDTKDEHGEHSTIGISIEGEWDGAQKQVEYVYYLWHARRVAEESAKVAFGENGCVSSEGIGLDEWLADHPHGVGAQRELDLITAAGALLDRETHGVQEAEQAARRAE